MRTTLILFLLSLVLGSAGTVSAEGFEEVGYNFSSYTARVDTRFIPGVDVVLVDRLNVDRNILGRFARRVTIIIYDPNGGSVELRLEDVLVLAVENILRSGKAPTRVVTHEYGHFVQCRDLGEACRAKLYKKRSPLTRPFRGKWERRASKMERDEPPIMIIGDRRRSSHHPRGRIYIILDPPEE